MFILILFWQNEYAANNGNLMVKLYNNQLYFVVDVNNAKCFKGYRLGV